MCALSVLLVVAAPARAQVTETPPSEAAPPAAAPEQEPSRGPESPSEDAPEQAPPEVPDHALPADAPLPAATPRTSDESQRPEDALRVRYTLENIEIVGNTRTRSRVVLRYVPFKTGDVIDVDDPAVELARYRLLGTGFFRDVQFSLRKGSQRGLVVLVIEVVERNTIVIGDLWMGLSADADTRGNARPLTAYGGLDVAETNLAGTGITLGGAVGIAQDQLALRVRFFDPAFVGTPWMTSTSLLYNSARDFFGNARVLYHDPEQIERVADHAVVRYKRFGGSLGIGRDLSMATQLWARFRLESIDASFPLQASHMRGYAREPIEFDIVRGESVLSALSLTVQLDTRDQPFLPTRGWFVSLDTTVGTSPFGSDYAFEKLQIGASRYLPLPHGHVLKLELFAGAIAGFAPFFEQYYVGDFSDFLPARILDANFDRRPPPNFFSTSIAEVRYGDYAAKVAAEYRIPLYRGSRSVFGIDFFGGVGIYGVASERDLTSPPVGYSGAARIPVDATVNLGFRMDTNAGGFVFAFSNVLGFIPVRGEGPAGE